jgi:hypothetical protein
MFFEQWSFLLRVVDILCGKLRNKRACFGETQINVKYSKTKTDIKHKPLWLETSGLDLHIQLLLPICLTTLFV